MEAKVTLCLDELIPTATSMDVVSRSLAVPFGLDAAGFIQDVSPAIELEQETVQLDASEQLDAAVCKTFDISEDDSENVSIENSNDLVFCSDETWQLAFPPPCCVRHVDPHQLLLGSRLRLC